VPPKRASLRDRPVSVAATPRPTDNLVLGAERRRQEVQELELREIMPNRMQPRTRPSSEGLEELAESIRQHGVLEPVLVRPIPLTPYESAGCRFELVAGERRWRASRLAGLSTIPAILLSESTDDRAMLELAITENLQREDLHPLDEALAFGRMQQELGYSYAQIAERLGKSKGYVQNRTRLLQLDEELQLLVAERPDTLGHVYELGRLSDLAARAELIAAVRDDRISRAETRARVEALLAPPPTPEPYFQKYDHPPPPAARASDSGADGATGERATEGKSYFQKYDDEQLSALDGMLTARERATLRAIAQKLAHHNLDPAALTESDWEALMPLARELIVLVQSRDEAA
jgi:ParB family chromosome partitioning protein